MSPTLVHEFVRLALQEATRSKTFSYETFESFELLADQLAYAREHLELLGESTRAVFLLSSGKVLKVAMNLMNGGIEQNKAEIEMAAEPRIAPIVTRVIDHDPHPKPSWLVAELVRPVVGESELLKLLGCDPWGDFGLKDITGYVWASDKVEQRRMVKAKPELSLPAVKTVTDGLKMMMRFDINKFDIDRHEHWGKTGDGRVVLLDYGLVDDGDFE